MPRQARQLSESGYFHVIVRGIGRQAIFEERDDYLFYLSILRRFSVETGVAILAYCLMENHVHLLLRDDGQRVSLMMKKMGVSYSQYFNKKYERCGHLFQDRFLSEAIENEAYLLSVFRYILNNPAKAGICPAQAYEWSSYALYNVPQSLVDLNMIRELLGDRYAAFVSEPNDDKCLECEAVPRGDNWAREMMRACLGEQSGMVLQALDRKARNAALRKLKEGGLTVRQIERLTGINRNIVQRA